ncbi:MAG: hypothetical protein GTN78_19300 [Gemmatimonadales bacterium]|nr:hypothetical protein [Gemmatimonadales bacterium]NIN13077.1 hypothetical protein [Gemmatimonadales bacterium]NIR02313.1 hypothetical protein [Gemmatimonadales bacterium]
MQKGVKKANPSSEVGMNLVFAAALVCLLAWIMLAFVVAIPSGWVHVLLAAGCLLLTKRIIEANRP